MADDSYPVNVHIYDDDREAKLKAIVGDSEHSGYGALADTLRDLIDEEFDRRDLDLDVEADGDDGEQPITEAYDPDDYDGDLSEDELRELSGEADEINVEHVPFNGVPQGEAIPVVAALARYEYDSVTQSDVEELCRDVGLVSDYYLTGKSNGINVPSQVVRMLGGEGQTTEEVRTDDDDEAVIQEAVQAALLRDVDDDVGAARSEIERTYEQYKQVDDGDRIDHYPGAANTDDVVRSALYTLSDKSTLHVATFETVDDVEWPRDAEGLVEWYIEENDPKWAGNDGLVDRIVEDIQRFADE